MLWTAAETAIRAHIEAAWALGSYAAMPLVFENETAVPDGAESYMLVTVEGTFADKSIYGGAGKRSSVEGGIVFFHAFTPLGRGKAVAAAPVDAMTAILELQVIATSIRMDGGNPPTPVSHGDASVPNDQPGGNFFRCSGSVPFIIIGTR